MNSFFNALSWNAFSYIAYKASYTLLSYILCARLTQQDFTIWATLLSFVFLALLVLDCGFRKSVPRYCPEFSYNPQLHASFIRWIGGIQAAVLVGALPIFYWLLPHFFYALDTQTENTIFILGTLLFFAEGCMGLMRLVYHAHFWNKQFNSLATGILFLELVLSGILTVYITESTLLMYSVLGIRCGGSFLIAAISFWYMPRVVPLDHKHPPATHRLIKQFALHSGAMWLANMLKSLTERNFLLPFITYTLGPITGIAFKLSNDAALFFYRSALRTIGSNDTALLSHARHYQGSMQAAFAQLLRTMVYLASPLLAGALISAAFAPYFLPTTHLIIPFLIFTCSYMAEVMLSPYERLLEVSRDYRSLTLAYVPYTVILLLFWHYELWALLGFIPCIVALQALRLLSSGIMVYCAHTRHSCTHASVTN